MSPALESVLRRDRAIVLGSLGGIAILAWLYLLRLAGGMAEMSKHAAMGMMPQTQPWGLVDGLLLFVMWAVMMLAMMVPSAAPMLLMFAVINRRRAEQHGPVVQTWSFLLGYLIVWTVYSGLAALAQWTLHGVALLSPMMVSTSHYLGGGLLVAAGVYQITPLKRACLTTCRSPVRFLMTEWRDGDAGAVVMGLRHGLYCVGCCWALMALLFVAGVMNLAWIATLAILVILEKIVPGGLRLSLLTGAALVVAGALMLTRLWP